MALSCLLPGMRLVMVVFLIVSGDVFANFCVNAITDQALRVSFNITLNEQVDIATITTGDQKKFWLQNTRHTGFPDFNLNEGAQYYALTHSFKFMRDFYHLFFSFHNKSAISTLVIDVLPGVVFHENKEIARLVHFLKGLTQHSEHKILFLISPLQVHSLKNLLSEKK
jgi:hypothetical protein